jgi:hypothetical protein
MLQRSPAPEEMPMFEIVCYTDQTSVSTIAGGFSDEGEARGTAQEWIARQFGNAAYDHSRECWLVLASPGEIYRVAVQKA